MIALPQILDFPKENNIREICNSLLTLLQKKDTGLYMHSQQVANYSACIAAKLGLPAAEIASIKSAALLHDECDFKKIALFKHARNGNLQTPLPGRSQHFGKHTGVCAYY